MTTQDRIKDRIVDKNVFFIKVNLMSLLFVLINVKNNARNVFLVNHFKNKLDWAIAKRIIQKKKIFVIDRFVSS